MTDVVNYEDTFDRIYTQILQELYDDHVMYAEIRTGFSPVSDWSQWYMYVDSVYGNVYDILQIYYKDGRIASKNEVVEQLIKVVSSFKKTHRNFLGAKFIFSVSRNNVPYLSTNLDLYQQLQYVDTTHISPLYLYRTIILNLLIDLLIRT